MSWTRNLVRSSSAALSDGRNTLSYTALQDEIKRRSEWLQQLAPQSVALEMRNGIEWALFDMACAEAGIPCIPIPVFFSDDQRQHTLTAAGVELELFDADSRKGDASPFKAVRFSRSQQQPVRLPQGTQKITFTSGSTGTPKGVCLSEAHQLATAKALAIATDIEQPVHLCVLPLATLLENIAGIFTPLLCGGTVYVPDNEYLGFSGSRLVDPGKLLQGINQFKPDSLILVPELLLFLVNAIDNGWRPPSSLRFIAVGGARVSPALLARAKQCQLPVYQGYGLSECGSVVALNTPADNREGAIGKPLPHIRTEIREGELLVRGNTFLGYLDDPESWYPTCVKTGDIVHQDEDGWLWFEGRHRNQIISSFGRNINPEWPESELLSDGLLRQAVVIGDDRPHCMAIVTPFASPSEQQLGDWLQQINRRLPDYAQVRQLLVLDQPMSAAHKLATDNGRPNRSAIHHFFADAIEALYQSPDVVARTYSMEV